MNKTRLLSFAIYSVICNNAFAIEPVFLGENGILATIFTPHCLVCHSSELLVENRTNAPEGVDFNHYAAALTNGFLAVDRAAVFSTMPPDFSTVPRLTLEQKEALIKWRALGFPARDLPPVFSFDSLTMTLPQVYLQDENGEIVQKLSAEMSLLPNPKAIQFEVTDFQVIVVEEPEPPVQ